MISLKLFMGYALSSKHTSRISLDSQNIYLNTDELSLQSMLFEGTLYLGKPMSKEASWNELEQMAVNITSLLMHIFPDQPVLIHELVVFATHDA